MELYLLDSNYVRETLIENYKSILWVDRVSDIGDFELVVEGTLNNLRLFVLGTLIKVEHTDRVMVIETRELVTDDDGQKSYKFTGRSVEKHLQERPGTRLTNTISGTPAEVLKILTYNTLGDRDDPNTLPFRGAGIIQGTIPFPTMQIQVFYDPTLSLYDLIKHYADAYGIGFRVRLDNNDRNGGIWSFDLYMGNDLTTTAPSNNSAVLFSEDLDNLKNLNEIASIANYKNMVSVTFEGNSGVYHVYAEGTDRTVSGFNRNTTFLEVKDPGFAEAADYSSYAKQVGQEELAKRIVVQAFDGEVPVYSDYVYGIDYNLGDYVDMKDSQGNINRMRVTEQIFTSDVDGYRSYPTLELVSMAGTNSWAGHSNIELWPEASGTWSQA